MQPNNQNPYDFILDPTQNQRSGGPNFGSKKRQKIIGIIFVLTSILVLIVVVSSILSGGGSKNDGLVSLQAYQTEINRVITLGQKNVADPAIKQELGTLKAVITSDQKQLSNLLSARGVVSTKLQLNSKKDPTIDTALSDALKTGDHDEILQQKLKSLVGNYYDSLTTAQQQTSSSKEKIIVNTATSNIEIVYKAE